MNDLLNRYGVFLTTVIIVLTAFCQTPLFSVAVQREIHVSGDGEAKATVTFGKTEVHDIDAVDLRNANQPLWAK